MPQQPVKPCIVFLSPVSYFKGGAERSLQDLLSNPSIKPVLLAPEEGPILEAGRKKGIDCVVLDFGAVNSIRRPFTFTKGLTALQSLYKAARTLKTFARAHNASAVHSNGLKAHMINCCARRLGGPKAIIHIRDIPYTKPEKLVWKIMYFMCDHMVLVSAACWPGHKLPPKCVVIHNGINVPADLPAPKTILKGATLTLGFVGRIHPAKGLHLLLDWMAHALKNGHTLKLSVRGSFSEDAPEYEEQIKEQINNLALTGYVEFLGHIDDPSKVYLGVDIVVVPSEVPDPLPRSVMEAMARGLIVFGYPAGGITDMIEDGKTGFLIKDAYGFTKTIQAAREEPAMFLNIVSCAQSKVRQDFSINNLHRRLMDMYSGR